MEKPVKISVLHVILLSMTVIGLKNHVTILPSILDVSNRDGWMSVILGAMIILPWLFLLPFTAKQFKEQTFNTWLDQKVGITFSKVLRFIMAIYLIIICAFTLREISQWGATTFLPRTPVIICIGIFIALCVLLATMGIQTLVIINVIVLFGVIVLGFFVAFVNIPVKDMELLRPFLEHGIEPVFLGAVYPAAGYVELLIFILIQHEVKTTVKFKHYALMLILLVGLTLGPLIGAITEFGPTEAAKQRYPAYEEWGIASIGRFIEHLDFFSIYQWMTGVFIRVSFLLYIATHLLNIQHNARKIWTYITPLFAFMSLALLLLGEQQFISINEHGFLVTTFIFFFVLGFLFALFTLIKKKSSKKKEELYVE